MNNNETSTKLKKCKDILVFVLQKLSIGKYPMKMYNGQESYYSTIGGGIATIFNAIFLIFMSIIILGDTLNKNLYIIEEDTLLLKDSHFE